MTNPVLDENLKQLFHRCAPRPNPDAVDRALARVEGRDKPAVRQGRLLVAAAAAVLVVLLGWMVVPQAPTSIPPRPAAQEDVARLIADLGSPSPEVREKATQRLIAMGPAALGPLDRAIYHEDPEVRIQAQALVKIARRASDIEGTLSFIRAAVKIVRAGWTARNFDNFDQMVQDAFEPEMPAYVHYVPKKTVDDAFDSLPVTNGGLTFKGGVSPGARDSLTAEMVDALNREGGMIFVNSPQSVTDLGPVCVFTLPDKVGWSAYVVVRLPEIESVATTPLRYAMEATDVAPFVQSLQVAPHTGGSPKIVDFDPKNRLAKPFRKGDLLKAVNGVPATSGQDLLQLSNPGDRPNTVTLDRNGKIFTAQFQVVHRVVIQKTERPAAEAEAQKLFDEAEKILLDDPDKALQLYRRLMTAHEKTDFVSKNKRPFIEERIAALEAKKARDKK